MVEPSLHQEATTYGAHQEAAAAALNRLVATDAVPVDVDHLEQLLACRTAALDSLRERLADLGAARTLSEGQQATLRRPSIDTISDQPVTMLDQVLAGLPTTRGMHDPAHNQLSPLHALTTPSPDPTVEAWREAARELMLGNRALEQTWEKPWLTEPAAAWWVIGDTAAAAEALAVLDDRLAEVGVHPSSTTAGTGRGEGIEQASAGWSLDERRVVTSQCARLSDWYATSDAADVATHHRTTGPDLSSPIEMVRLPGDLAPAQRNLARMLQPSRLDEAFSDTAPRMDANLFRVTTRTQQHLCETFARAYGQSPAYTEIAQGFAQRAEVLADLAHHGRHLVDIAPGGTNQRARWQLLEIGAGQRRFNPAALEPRQALDLLAGTNHVIRQLGTATRHEARRTDSHLRLRARAPESGLTRIGHTSAFGVALQGAARIPAPITPSNNWMRPVNRTALRITLDTTASKISAPNPLKPPRRGLGY